MSLFSRNTGTQVVVAIEYVTILLSAGFSREHILNDLSSKKLGNVSAVSKHAITDMNAGKSYAEALALQEKKCSHPYLKKFLHTLNAQQGVNISNMLTDLSNEIMKEKQLTIDTLLDSLSSGMQKLMLIITIPLCIFFIDIIVDAIPSLSYLQRTEVDYVLYGIALLLFLWTVMKMRYHE